MSSTKEMKIPLGDIITATNGFSEDNVIGKGGFGIVYKGILEKHGVVAIKRLVPHGGQGDHEFQTEIIVHSKLTHENISSLYGFCDDDGEKILVYKYESNLSLDIHLNNSALTWIQRLQICIDAASGLKYVHDDFEPYQSVFHRDVKSANILLDDNWNAKLCDFGLAKIGPAHSVSTPLLTHPCGTLGYVDPEYISSGILTQNSDVFSFGVVLFEVLCGRRAYNKDDSQIFNVMVQEHFKNKTLDKIICSYLLEQIDASSLLTFSTIAYQCLMNREERPTMISVLEKLKKALDNQLLTSQGQLLDLYDGAHYQTQSETTASSFDSAPPTTSGSRKYDVFLSFRGVDTRKTFVDHLYTALKHQGIKTYKDDETLCRGELISSSLLKAIKESHIALIVFSKNYADSGWCLDELLYILECRDTIGQIVIPIFYNVDPSDVRKQKGEYGEALKRQELLDSKKVELWRKSLIYASNIAGWSSNNTNGESMFIQNIVYAISNKLHRLKESAEESVKQSVTANLIGIQTRIQDFKPLLRLRSGGVHMVGICGIWGSGKSTLASTIYDEISNQFEGCCFVQNVCDETRMYGLKTLQEKILSDVLKSKMKLEDINDGIEMMERRLRNNKVLIVLDNVDHIDLLKMLAGSRNWFGDGSRIIFTTRNQDLLGPSNIGIYVHRVKMLDDDEAIKLFSRCAFGSGQSVEGHFKTVSLDIVSRLGGNPALLIKLGSFLHGKHMNDWTNTLDRIKGISIAEIPKLFQDGDGVFIGWS